MLIPAKQLYGALLEGSDGRVGTLYDLLFDDQSWAFRHLVVSVDRWFLGRQVLLEPSMGWVVEGTRPSLRVGLTKQQIRSGPDAETDLPVARQRSVAAAQVLVWEAYWTSIDGTSTHRGGDPCLHSTKMLSGLRICCSDGPLGHVADFLIDTQSWSVAELIVDTRNWWPGKRVLIEPTLVEAIDWDDRQIRLYLPRELVEHRPAYGTETLAEETALPTA